MSSSYVRLYAHFVWATSERRPLLDDRTARHVHARLAAICQSRRCLALAVGGVADHVHLLVDLHPSTAISDLVRALKVNTSQFIVHELKTPGFSWQGGYGAFTLRESETETVRRYIMRQPQHHADEAIIPEWERSTCNPAQPGDP